jgi:hypothetical protein
MLSQPRDVARLVVPLTRRREAPSGGTGRLLRGTDQAATESAFPIVAQDAPGEPVAAQLRRRRAAANRLPPLPDGRRDPLDPKPGRRRSLRVLSVTEDPANGRALLRGIGSKQLAVDLGLTPQWSDEGRGWVVDAAHVADLLALGEHLHYCVSYRERTS